MILYFLVRKSNRIIWKTGENHKNSLSLTWIITWKLECKCYNLSCNLKCKSSNKKFSLHYNHDVVIFVLCCRWAPRHEGILRSGVNSSTHSFLTSAIGVGEWWCSSPGRFTTWDSAPITHPIRIWVDFKAYLDMVAKRKFPSPHRESKPRTPIVQP